MMAWPIVHFSVWLTLLCLFTVSALPASRNFTVIKLIPPSTQQKDTGISPVPQENGKGVMADQRSAFLGDKADAFRFHRPGFEHVPGSVSLESAVHPGLYLRYKNYKFHLEKMKPTGVFEKDATFIERKTQTKGATAYELFNHPGWFMCHDTNSTFGLVAKKLEIGSNDFLVGCLYMSVAVTNNPTKKITTDENGTARANIHNITSIISNDVSPENLAKADNFNSGSESKVATNNGKQSVGKGNATVGNLQQPKLLSNPTSDKNIGAAKPMDIASGNNTVANSTKQMVAIKQLNDEKNVNDTHVMNATQNTLKPNIDLLNKTNILASHKATSLLRNNSKTLEHHAAESLQNHFEASGNANTGNQKSLSKQKSPYSESADQGSAALHIQNALQGAFMEAKHAQQTQMGLANGKNLKLAKGIGVAEGTPNQLHKGSSPALQQNQNGLHLPIGPNKAANQNGPSQFNLHFEFPIGQTQGNNFHQTVNGLPGPAQLALPGQLAQITAKALGLMKSGVKNQQNQQMGLQYSKGAGLPFTQQQQQQRKQQQFHRPVNYLKQQMGPQASFRAPNFVTSPEQVTPGRPLANPFAVKGQRPQFAYKQTPLVNSGYNYHYPFKSWGGMVSVGKQSLVGNSALFHGITPTKPFAEKTSAKLEDDMSSKIPDKNDKCISLKFINKIRKPVKLVSSMKLGGYLITAETFKLKTIFKHPRKHHHVIFYARDADDIDNEVLLNNNNAIAVTPGSCDLPFRSLLLSHHGQISNDEIERRRKEEDEYETSMEAVKKAVVGKGDENFSQWTAFGPCGDTCGRSLQTRTRSCKPGRVCKGPAVESRNCIQTPCPVATCVRTYSGKCCALPFVFRSAAVNRCLIDPKTNRSWCATTPNFDKEKRWAYCQPSGPHTKKIIPVIRSYLPGSPRQLQPLSRPCSVACARICMSWCPQHCCMGPRHR